MKLKDAAFLVLGSAAVYDIVRGQYGWIVWGALLGLIGFGLATMAMRGGKSAIKAVKAATRTTRDCDGLP